ncbi:hypothetical protein [Endozoicomonas sp. ALC066]|uniref:hypothetical protein n=1 Tax=Endozoicomonas sp. ALC066 TaxID=3403078 RepID=UPI003BB6B055
METHSDLKQWAMVQGESKPLQLGTRVRLYDDHVLKSEWPGEYIVTGLILDRDNRLDITIGPGLDRDVHDSCEFSGEWRIEDFVAV